MKKFTMAVLSVLLAGMFTFSLVGCTFFAPTDSETPGGGDGQIVMPDPDVDPDEPDTPVDPDEPDEPDTPVDPDEPDTPVDPDEPDTPVDPDEPDTPVDPDEPDTPVDPDEPDTPVDPDEPDDPAGDTTEDDSTELYRLYQDAKKDGYTGTFVDFLKELGYGGSEEPAYTVGTAIQSVVSVSAVYYEDDADLTAEEPEIAATFSGAGVIYSLDKEEGDAYIITNYHVVYEQDYAGIADEIRVYLYGQHYLYQYIVANYVGGAMEFDIAVLRIEDSEQLKESAALAAKLGDSNEIKVGETVYAIGNPNSEGHSVTRGVVSVPYEQITDIDSADGTHKLSLFEIRVDAAINHGNSGGGLFNADGELIGIVNARIEGGYPAINDFGYAILSNIAVGVAQNIIDNVAAGGEKGAFRATLGVEVQVDSRTSTYDEETGISHIVETLSVKSVTAGAPADGIFEVGDIIKSIAFEGGEAEPTVYLHTVTTFMFDVRKGDTVVITYERGGIEYEARITYNDDSMFTLFA